MPSSVDLGDALETVVTKLVATGCYNSKSEVLRRASAWYRNVKRD
jgi:Arc/MetJ-type ribon-helix-helix transcriptional regulator